MKWRQAITKKTLGIYGNMKELQIKTQDKSAIIAEVKKDAKPSAVMVKQPGVKLYFYNLSTGELYEPEVKEINAIPISQQGNAIVSHRYNMPENIMPVFAINKKNAQKKVDKALKRAIAAIKIG